VISLNKFAFVRRVLCHLFLRQVIFTYYEGSYLKICKNMIPDADEPPAVTLPARRSSEELRDSDVLCSCLIMTKRKLKYSIR
jgi:hypothetical protein